MKTWTVTTVAETAKVAQTVIDMLVEHKDAGCASVLALHGDLGAGKTTFMQQLAAALGVSETVVSPTFVVMKGYEMEHPQFAQLIHIDAYRIEDEDEMRPLHFQELLEEPNTLIGIEWAELIAGLLPEHTLHLQFSLEGTTRTITAHYGQTN